MTCRLIPNPENLEINVRTKVTEELSKQLPGPWNEAIKKIIELLAEQRHIAQ